MRMSWLTPLVAIILACALSACGGGGNSGNSSSGSNGSSSNPGGNGSGSNSGSDSGSTGGQTTYIVTPSVNGAGGAISSSVPISAQPGTTASFTLTPNSGYSIGSVGGTCGGSLSGNTYTTQPVTANCTVEAGFTQTSPEAGSLAECIKMPPKNHELLVVVDGQMPGTYTTQISFAPVTFMGEAAWERVIVYSGPFIKTKTDYATIRNAGICTIAQKDMYGTFVYPTPDCISPDMKPDDSYDWPGFTRSLPTTPPGFEIAPKIHSTFIGFEAVTVNGKTFSNACRFKIIEELPDSISIADNWLAEGITVRNIMVNTAVDGSVTTITTEFKRDL